MSSYPILIQKTKRSPSPVEFFLLLYDFLKFFIKLSIERKKGEVSMSTKLNGQALLTQAAYGLNSTYANLMTGNTKGGLSLSDITNPSSEVNKNNLNWNFSYYMSQNFSTLDKNSDGILSQSEMQNAINGLSTDGMTYEQLTQLCYTNGGSSTLLDTVLTHFNEIDKNHDGKVTNAEIAAYGVESEKEDMEKKYKSFDPSSFSIFYSSDISNNDDSSILDNKET